MLWRRLLAFAIFATSPVTSSWAATCTPTVSNSVCVITTGTTTNSTSSGPNYVTYAWNSATASPKTQSVMFACTTNPFTFIVKDEIGMAGTVGVVVAHSPRPSAGFFEKQGFRMNGIASDAYSPGVVGVELVKKLTVCM